MNLSKDETKYLISFLENKSRESAFNISLNGLINNWIYFIGQVIQGYEGCDYEYFNDLSNRDILEELLESAPYSLRDKIKKEIKGWDSKFKSSTYEINKPLLQNKEHWWWFRLPIKLMGQLKMDFKVYKKD
jgi:hypothetical protein